MQKPYVFVLNGKLLEHESLIELKADLPTIEDWYAVVAQTIDFYFQLEAVDKSKEMTLERKDMRVMRSLRRTIAFIKKLDPVSHNRFYLTDTQNSYKEIVAKEVSAESSKSIRIGYGNKPDGTSDIVVSNLDG